MIFLRRHSLVWLTAAWAAVGITSSFAGTIHYGDFGPDFPPGITIYQDVVESSGTDPVPPARYGPPTLSVNSLVFEPKNFVASSAGGGADITDAQLNFEIDILKGLNNEVAGGIQSFVISERGDFSLFGAGTIATSVAAGVSIDVEILEVDGNPITPLQVFRSNAISRDLPTDGPALLEPWSNGLLVEFVPVLNNNNIDFKFGVTKANVVINDQLIAISEPTSSAFIAKKRFTIEPGEVPNPDFEPIPEPASMFLLVALMAGAYGCRRMA